MNTLEYLKEQLLELTKKVVDEENTCEKSTYLHKIDIITKTLETYDKHKDLPLLYEYKLDNPELSLKDTTEQ